MQIPIRFLILVISSAPIFSSSAVPIANEALFPEERGDRSWDAVCADWPINLSDDGSSVANPLNPPNPQITSFKKNGYFRISARLRLSPEIGESLASLSQSVDRLLTIGTRYPEWVLPGINEKAGGDRYFVTVESMTAKEIEANRRYLLSGNYTFRVLWFAREGFSTLEFRRDEVPAPKCPLFAELGTADAPRFIYRMTPRKDLLELMIAEIYLIPNATDKFLELRLRLIARAAPLVYALMPERLMKNELAMRGRRLFENFAELRKREAWTKAPTPSAAPLLPVAQKLKKARAPR